MLDFTHVEKSNTLLLQDKNHSSKTLAGVLSNLPLVPTLSNSRLDYVVCPPACTCKRARFLGA